MLVERLAVGILFFKRRPAFEFRQAHVRNSLFRVKDVRRRGSGCYSFSLEVGNVGVIEGVVRSDGPLILRGRDHQAVVRGHEADLGLQLRGEVDHRDDLQGRCFALDGGKGQHFRVEHDLLALDQENLAGNRDIFRRLGFFFADYFE